ncbi:MAG: hypothetical protein Fur0043_12970 [Anaerolineales bacterium]
MARIYAHYLYVYTDGTYFTVIYNGKGCKMPLLAIVVTTYPKGDHPRMLRYTQHKFYPAGTMSLTFRLRSGQVYAKK